MGNEWANETWRHYFANLPNQEDDRLDSPRHLWEPEGLPERTTMIDVLPGVDA